ncbi:hypothetical protein PilKf_00360 [Pillotina sp. SPG140]
MRRRQEAARSAVLLDHCALLHSNAKAPPHGGGPGFTSQNPSMPAKKQRNVRRIQQVTGQVQWLVPRCTGCNGAYRCSH